MKYAILAAGEGSRLACEGVGEPKPLVRMGGETLVDRLIRIFRANGAEEIAIVVNGCSPAVAEHIIALRDPMVRLAVRNTPSSMHSLYELMPLIGKGRFCLTTVDTVFREDEFAEYIRRFSETKADGLMGVTEFVDDEKPLFVGTDREFCITGFHDERAGCRFVSGGVYGLSDAAYPTLGRCVSEGQERMRNFQRQLVADGMRLVAYPFGKILDIDHAADVVKAKKFLGL